MVEPASGADHALNALRVGRKQSAGGWTQDWRRGMMRRTSDTSRSRKVSVKLTYVIRRPRYPVLCEVAGDVIAARSRQQLERRLSAMPLPADATLRMVDRSGEGWGVHVGLRAISPLVLKKNWTKAELLRLYRDSATGRRHGLPYREKDVLRERLDTVILILADLVARAKSSPEAKLRCGLCGKATTLIETECCGRSICNDEDTTSHSRSRGTAARGTTDD